MAFKKKKLGILPTLALSVAILLMFGLFLEYTNVINLTALGDAPVQQTGFPSGDGTGIAGALQTNVGEASTITFTAYTGQWSGALAEASVGETYTMTKNGDSLIVDDTTATSSTSYSVGDTGEIWVTGATAYLRIGDSQTFTVPDATPSVRIEVMNVTTATGLQITIRDENDDALTADDHVNNTASYAGGNIAAGQDVEYIVKFQQATADRAFNLGAVCTYYATGQEADDFRLSRTDSAKVHRYNEGTGTMEDVSSEFSGVTWGSVAIPKALVDATVNGRDDLNVTTTMSYKHCYEASKPIMLLENDWIKLVFEFESDDTTQPSANGDTYIGAGFMDYACNRAKSGITPICGWVRWNDGTEDPGAIGLDENIDAVFNGTDQIFQIEPQ